MQPFTVLHEAIFAATRNETESMVFWSTYLHIHICYINHLVREDVYAVVNDKVGCEPHPPPFIHYV